jgi:hypothetical protein
VLLLQFTKQITKAMQHQRSMIQYQDLLIKKKLKTFHRIQLNENKHSASSCHHHMA